MGRYGLFGSAKQSFEAILAPKVAYLHFAAVDISVLQLPDWPTTCQWGNIACSATAVIVMLSHQLPLCVELDADCCQRKNLQKLRWNSLWDHIHALANTQFAIMRSLQTANSRRCHI